ncbi:integrase [Erwinia typographi]|uniref:Integrase n=1 Tax=Erwinia typographi TaxID=371042 RepID=A0A0A3YSI3_9GAMM|nr:DUF5906 domain-containing protein [Erwinia typographi]KGT88306.1 integrase [Erwinia typographi]
MKNAPNLKHLPDDKNEEAVIFAGANAWILSKDYASNNKTGDTIPPITLGVRQLAELETLNVIDNGRKFARVYRSGKISQDRLTMLARKLAAEGVKSVQLYSEAGEMLEDWTGQLPAMKEQWESENLPALHHLGDGTAIDGGELEALQELNEIYTHVLAFGDHHVASMRANPVTGETHTFQTLNSFRNNFLDTRRIANRRLGEAWLQWPGHAKKLAGVGFYPNPDLCPEGVYNLFNGLAVEPESGDCSPYLDHLRTVICAGNEEAYQYLVGWLAHLFQKPQEKPSVAVVMKSIEGTGKGTMVKPIIEALGMYGVQVNGPGQIAGRFNGTIANKLFVFVDEAELTDPRASDRLKAIISEPTINLERKGKDPEPMPNYARFVFASNHDRVIRAGMRERRYLVLEPDGSKAQEKGYFDRLHQWIKENGSAKLLAWLLDYDLGNFDPRRPPVTSALVEEKLASLPPAYQYIYSEIWSGNPFNGQANVTAAELVNRFMLWCETQGEDIKEAAARSAIGKVMSRLGLAVMGRSGRGIGKHYEMPLLVDLQERFAGLIGEDAGIVFN